METNPGFENLMKEAQKMQQKMQDAQAELTKLIVTGTAGAGLVTIEMNGRHDVKKVNIKESLMDDDKDMLEDLIAAAINDAVLKIEKKSKEKIQALTAGIQLPKDFNLPNDQE